MSGYRPLSSTSIITGTVPTYGDLPSPASAHTGELYFVEQGSGGLLSWVPLTEIYKYPKGLYSPNSSDVWEQVPMNVRVAEDALTLVNIIDWAEFYAYAFDVNAGDRIVFNGVDYQNRTGTQSSTSPDLDTANWSLLSPLYATVKHDTNYTETGSEVIGESWWNPDETTLNVKLTADVTGQMFEETFFCVRNQTGSLITNGTPVMFAGTLGASGKLLIQEGIADGSLQASYAMGITTEDIPNEGNGKVTWFGKVRGLDTSGTPYGETWNDGDILYYSPLTAGYLTNVQPQAPDLAIEVCAVVYAHASNGSLIVRPHWHDKLTDLDDVNGTPLTVTGQILVWDHINKYFDFSHNIVDIKSVVDANEARFKDNLCPNGVVDRSETNPATINASREVSYTLTGAEFNYYSNSTKYTRVTGDTITVPDVTGNYWVYYDDNGTLQYVNAFQDEIIQRWAFITEVYWNATLGKGIAFDERHGSDRVSTQWHQWTHEFIGARYKSGGGLNTLDTTGDGDTDSHAQFGVDAGEYRDEDIPHTLSAVLSTTGLRGFYLNGIDWEWDDPTGFNCKRFGPTSRLAFNDAGAQTEVANNDFVLSHIFFTPIGGGEYVYVQGQAQYTTLASARAGADAEINALILSGLPSPELKYIGNVIFQTGNGYGNAVQARARANDAGDDWTDYRNTGQTPAGVGSASFLSLSDTPSSYVGQAGKLPIVSDTETGLDFTDEYVPELSLLDQNQILNASFEEGTGDSADNWTQHATYTRSDVLSRIGDFSMLYSGDGAVHTCSQTFDILPRTVYKIQAWCYIPDIAGEAVTTVAVDASDIDGEFTLGLSGAVKDQWQTAEIIWDSREYSSVTLRLLTNASNNATPQLVYWDNISVVPFAVGRSASNKPFEADQFETPDNADWPIVTNAYLTGDPTGTGNNDKKVAVFDDTADRALGFTHTIPGGSTYMVQIIDSKSQGGGGGDIVLRLWVRQTTPDSAEPAWSGPYTLSAMTFASNTNPHQHKITTSLLSLGLTAGLKTHFMIASLGTGQTLSGNWLLSKDEVFFT